MTYATPEIPDDSYFWAEAEQGRLAFQRCGECGFMRWPAAGVCPECLSRSFRWESVEPTGTVWSYAVYHRAYSADTKERVPYNVALVELDCGVRLVSTLVDFPDGSDGLDGSGGLDGIDAVGARVVARWQPVGEHAAVPVFAPADQGRAE